MKRFTLTDLIDKKNLLAWLNADGKPPTAMVRSDADRARGLGYGWENKVQKPVTNEETLDAWWSDYRAALRADFEKSALNTHKPQTHKQFIADCLRSLGIKGFGTVAERVQRAVAFRPDIYRDAASVKAEKAAEAARLKTFWEEKLAEGRARRAAEDAVLKESEDARAVWHADLMNQTSAASGTGNNAA
jgi:hypothetical protein